MFRGGRWFRQPRMTMKSLDALVRELADREAIRDLARAYADCVWRKDAAGAAALFADDAVMDLGDRPPIVGRAALLVAYQSWLTGSDFQPFVHNHVVQLSGNRATGRCYLDLRANLNGRRMIGSGYYNDRYVCCGEGWRFQSRRLTMVFLEPLDEG